MGKRKINPNPTYTPKTGSLRQRAVSATPAINIAVSASKGSPIFHTTYFCLHMLDEHQGGIGSSYIHFSYGIFAYSSPMMSRYVDYETNPRGTEPYGNQRCPAPRIRPSKCPALARLWKESQKKCPLETTSRKSFAPLATHIPSAMTGWAADTINKDSFDISPPGAPPYKEELAASNKELLAKFDKSVASARAAIAGASDEVFLKPWSLMAAGKTLFTMPRIACVRSFVMNHVIHHRAQLGVYLRLNVIHDGDLQQTIRG